MTKTQAITAALRKLGVIAPGEAISGDDYATGLEALNNLSAEMEIDQILLYGPAEDDVIPERVYRSVVDAIAFEIGPEYGKTLPGTREDMLRRLRRYANQPTDELPVCAKYY